MAISCYNTDMDIHLNISPEKQLPLTEPLAAIDLPHYSVQSTNSTN